MLMPVRRRDNRFRVISALLMQEYKVARGLESVTRKELIAPDLVELGDRGEYCTGIR
jgi:hypothetical protein